MSVVYASNDSRERLIHWDHLQEFLHGKANPWIVIVDLNYVLFSYERMMGEPVHPSEISH